MEDYKSSNTAYLSDFVYKTRKILNRKGPKLYTVYILSWAKIGEKRHLVLVG